MCIRDSIFCTVVSGIAGMQNMKSVGKTGGYALLYFEIVSTIALIIGLVVVNVVKPGAGMHIDVSTLNASSVAAYAAAGAQQTTVGFLLNVIPNTVIGDSFMIMLMMLNITWAKRSIRSSTGLP